VNDLPRVVTELQSNWESKPRPCYPLAKLLGNKLSSWRTSDYEYGQNSGYELGD